MEDKPKCNRWFLLLLYFLISFSVCGLVGSFTAILPLLRKACMFSNLCRCDPSTKNYRGDDCLNPELKDLILLEPLLSHECDPIGCNLQNVLHVDAWKFGLSAPLIASPIAGTIADIIGPRALGTIGTIFVCCGLLIWLLLTNIFEVLWIAKYLLSLSWLFLGIGRKLSKIKQFITCQEEMANGNQVRKDFGELEKSTTEEDILITCPKTVQLRARSEVTNVKIKIKCCSSEGVECESSAMCNLKASSAIMGGYSVVCSLAKCRYMLKIDKIRSFSTPSNIFNVFDLNAKNSLNTIIDRPIFEQLFSYEYFTFMALFIYNFWRCSILVSKSEYIVTSVLYINKSVGIEQEMLQIMNIYNIIMSLGSIFSVIWGIIATKYGVNFMIGLTAILGCLIHVLLIFIDSLPFWCIYLYFCAFSALRSFIFGSLNCFIGDTFGFSNFARLAGIQAFTCFIFFQIMNFLTSQYFEVISWAKVNQYLLIPNIFLLSVPFILNLLKAKRNN
ncbi:hypothetical predicted multi-pass transmembrane protein, unknown function [Cryptosporidium parvum]|uniref:Uncharacterized protein n=1 Tax=Cryptosporidium parvum TaxID=5807 RepID=A0A7G2HJN3_CRYPV|nr:hypothetical predicted multi-pass transmembrane protein, unknown function [Cryptosporidium parvum]